MDNRLLRLAIPPKHRPNVPLLLAVIIVIRLLPVHRIVLP